MIDQTVVDYIKNARAKNISDDVIRQALILNGWNEQQVQTALNVTAEVSGAPSNPSPFTKPSTVPATFGIHKTGWNSPLSNLLAIVLFISLLILANHIVKDLVQSASDISSQLIVNAFVVVPFLLIAFILHFTFNQHEQKTKYLIIAQPYYIISGWLLLKLFFKVSQYILDKNAAYGVYVVLILIVVVLTGIIFFVQKFVRSK